jgi:hypothetical protein
MVLDSGAQFHVIEAAFGNRPHVVTQADNPNHTQLRTFHELWHKENLINLAIARLPSDWEYVAWIDADVAFARPDWVNETLNQLQHFHIVQMFSIAHNLAPDYTVMQEHPGFMSKYKKGDFNTSVGKMTCYEGSKKVIIRKPYYAHPGLAWAARRQAIEDLGGLLDTWILGSADWHMAYALIGKAQQTINSGWTQALKDTLLEWQDRAEKYIKRNVGFVPGSLFHHWHGKKKDRRYNNRAEILINSQYDPNLHIKKDSQGLWQLTDKSIKLRDEIRAYMSSRNEDSTDLE